MTTRTLEPQPTLFDRPVGLLRLTSPLGRIELTSDGASVTGLSLENDGHLPRDGYREAPIDLLLDVAEQLAEYFSGDRTRFDVPLFLEGTAFQQRIWQALARIPFGEARTYGALGHDAGVGRAGRAVGGAVRANPAPILVPCHRVLGGGGRVVGYSQGNGVSTKHWLLNHERIAHR